MWKMSCPVLVSGNQRADTAVGYRDKTFTTNKVEPTVAISSNRQPVETRMVNNNQAVMVNSSRPLDNKLIPTANNNNNNNRNRPTTDRLEAILTDKDRQHPIIKM